MFLALTTFNSCIVRRNIFKTITDAKRFAIEECKVKVHMIGDSAFYGDFNVIVYNFENKNVCNHVDIPVYVEYGRC